MHQLAAGDYVGAQTTFEEYQSEADSSNEPSAMSMADGWVIITRILSESAQEEDHSLSRFAKTCQQIRMVSLTYDRWKPFSEGSETDAAACHVGAEVLLKNAPGCYPSSSSNSADFSSHSASSPSICSRNSN